MIKREWFATPLAFTKREGIVKALLEHGVFPSRPSGPWARRSLVQIFPAWSWQISALRAFFRSRAPPHICVWDLSRGYARPHICVWNLSRGHARPHICVWGLSRTFEDLRFVFAVGGAARGAGEEAAVSQYVPAVVWAHAQTAGADSSVTLDTRDQSNLPVL